MKDPWNPVRDEIHAWAYDPVSLEPDQDWQLAVAGSPYEDLYLELAATKSCPKADYFFGRSILDRLYLIVGDAVRTGYRTRTKIAVEALLQKAAECSLTGSIGTWVRRSRELLAFPDRFAYDDWCDGGLAYGKKDGA